MKVFKVNEYEWYMAPTLEEAVQQAMQDSGLPRDEAVENPVEVTPEQMNKLVFTDDEGQRWSFSEELQRRIKAQCLTQMFASTLE